ncbi:MAG: methyl-accepting chemotaxis protein [Firmicutes bacterium]|nr:methyl-accepting chemotaxis protein [Bacillota bacterium]
MKLRFRKVSTKIAIYAVLLLTVTCVGLAYLAYNQGSQAVMEEVERAVTLVAQEASGYLETKLQGQLEVLATIAARPEMVWMDWGAQRLALRSEAERLTEFNRFGVVAPEGNIRYTDNTTAKAGDEPYIATAFAGIATVSDLMVDKETGEMTIILAVPIISNNNVVGVLMGERGYATLGEIVDHLGFGERGWAYILNEQGIIMAHPDSELVLEGISVFDQSGPLAPVGEALAELDLSTPGVIHYQTSDGTRRIDAMAPSAMTGWTLAVGAIENDVLGNILSLRNFMLGISILFIVVGVGASVILGRQIARPLATVQQVMEEVAKGSFASRVQLNSEDEVGMVAEALNRTVDEISQAIRGVADTTNNLARMSREMAATSEEVSASVEEVASTTNEFSTTIEQVHSRAMGVRDRAQRISSEAVRGESALTEIIKQLGAVREDTHALSNDINQLDSLSTEIGSILNTITAISDQTDLLALNAAIEAARAGEHGRGFAVVADEVRRLAEQTSHAAAEIDELIGEIQQGIKAAVNGMGLGAQRSDVALEQVKESGLILQEILRTIGGIVEEVQYIVGGLDEVNYSGTEIASVTEEQAASIAQVSNSAQSLMEMAGYLQGLVGRFKLD